MSSYNLGAKTLKRLVLDANSYAYFQAKLTQELFKGEGEQELFNFVNSHFQKYQALPDLSTIIQTMPDFAEVEAPDVAKYYLDLIENRFVYDRINRANIDSQNLLKENKNATDEALKVLEDTIGAIMEQRYRTRLLDMGLEGGKLVLGTYYGLLGSSAPAGAFGWPYMDDMCQGILPGDVISIVGRPAMGKTWFLLYIALHNWIQKHLNVLFVSMEMNTISVAQRIAAMYAGTNITQLKGGVAHGYATKNQTKFEKAMQSLATEQSKFYIVDGNLAANPDEIYTLARQLGCNMVCIDGAYMLRSTNPRLGRFEKVADNIERMKQRTSEYEMSTAASWQFNRDATKKMEKKGAKPGLEDIGYSDAIGQISSIALGLMQEEGVATLETRSVDVMKGRNGEIGQFDVNWLFGDMNFDQVGTEKKKKIQQLMHID